jgi:hypothetical protein
MAKGGPSGRGAALAVAVGVAVCADGVAGVGKGGPSVASAALAVDAGVVVDAGGVAGVRPPREAHPARRRIEATMRGAWVGMAPD